jgi:hypothetical protein
LAVLQGARRENILYGSSTDEQRSSSGKDRQPGGLFSGGPIPYFDFGSKSLMQRSLCRRKNKLGLLPKFELP